MTSLAQAIIDTAQLMATRPNKARLRFDEAFFEATRKERGYEAAVNEASAAIDWAQDIPLLSPLIKKAMRFSLDESVSGAIGKMLKTPTETLLKALKYAEPPHNPTWLELTPATSNSPKGGWLIEKRENEFHIYEAMSSPNTNHLPLYNKDLSHAVITTEGFRLYNEKIDTDTAAERVELICRPVLSALLLLNSRSNILKVAAPANDLTKLNRARVKNGKEEIVSFNTVSFDVARTLTRGNHSDEKIAAQEMAAALVRGHFKVRQTGVFFWSPYVRGARDDEHRQEVYTAKIGEQREVTASGPAFLPQ